MNGHGTGMGEVKVDVALTALVEHAVLGLQDTGHAACHQSFQTQWMQCLGPARSALRPCRSLLLHAVSKLCKAGSYQAQAGSIKGLTESH